MDAEDREKQEPEKTPEAPLSAGEGVEAEQSPVAEAPVRGGFSAGEWVAVVGLGLIIVLAGVWIFSALRKDVPDYAKPRNVKMVTYSHLDKQEFGSPEAKVRVVALLPLESACQADRVEYVYRIAKACPEHMHLRFVDIKAPHGMEEVRKYGLGCAGLIVNEKNSFHVEVDGAIKDVALKGGPDEGYTLGEVRAVLAHELAAAYGDKAPQVPAADVPGPSAGR